MTQLWKRPDRAIWTANLTLLASAVFLLSFGQGLLGGARTNFFIDTLGLTGEQVLWLEGIREIPGLALMFIAAAVMHLPLVWQTAAYILIMGVGYALYAPVDSYGTLVAVAIFASLGMHGWMPLNSALVMSLTTKEKSGQIMGVLSSVTALASIVGMGGIALADKVLPALTDVLKIAADNDLVVATGHFPYDPDHKTMLEEAKRVGVKRMEIIHPAHIHCKTSIAQMKEAASEGVKLMLSGLGTTTFPLHETGPVYAVKMIKEVGADNIVYGSDYGQIHNPPHVVGTRWLIKLLLSYGATNDEVRKVMQETPAEHLGLD